jgi:3-oxoacyl-[acyl-carrier protein] reductase
VKSIPIGRGGESADVAGAVLYLVSDLGNFITGETIEINGGMFMR